MKLNDNFNLQRVLMLNTPNLLNKNFNSKDIYAADVCKYYSSGYLLVKLVINDDTCLCINSFKRAIRCPAVLTR